MSSLDLVLLGVQFDLELVEYPPVVLVQGSVEQNPDVVQPEAPVDRPLSRLLQPADIALAVMETTLSVVNQVVNLPF